LAYVFVGLVVAVVGGTLIGRAGMEDQVADFVRNAPVHDNDDTMTKAERIRYARDQLSEIIYRVWLYVLIGVGIGAAIHNWVPETIISTLLGQDKWWSVPVATMIGVPMYADIFWTLPIAEALIGKGVGLGTVLAFMMAVTALSMPSIIMLKRVVKLPLLVLFLTVVTGGILGIGFLFNAITDWFIWKENILIIKILGSGCKKCLALGKNAKSAAEAAGDEVEIIKVTDFAEIAGYGVMSTPGLVINEKLVSAGKVLSVEEIRALFWSCFICCLFRRLTVHKYGNSL
jgi:small redox-active disulfide protein 2